jgi:uncharacterized repeat protein (TIGR01451 family)
MTNKIITIGRRSTASVGAALLLLLSSTPQVFATGETVNPAAVTLPPGKTVTVRFRATVDNPQPAGATTITNDATVTGTNFPAATSNTTSHPLGSAPNLAVTISDGGASVTPGGTVAYTVTYANNGNQGASGVTLTVALDISMTFGIAGDPGSSSGWACNAITHICVSNVGTVAGLGGGGTRTLVVTLNPAVGSGVASVTQSVLISDDGLSGTDPNPGDNSSSDTTPVHRPSATALVSSSNPSVFGQSVTFTATVTTPAAGTPTGSVTFFDSGVPMGPAVPLIGNQATLTTNLLSVAPHPITATYGGDATFDPSTSTPALAQVVNKASTTTTLAPLSQSIFGQSVTFSATVGAVAPGSGTPTGTVSFLDGATVIGSGTLNGSGVATFTTSTLTVGTHSISASYPASANLLNSASAPASQVVINATTTVLTSSANPQRPGYNVTFTATVTGTNPTPNGTVTFRDGATTLATIALNASGVATLTVNNLTLGVHPITADYPGNVSYGPSSGALTQIIANNPPSRPGVVHVNASGPPTVFLRGSLSSGNGDLAIAYGAPSDQFLAGDWTDKGFDTIGLSRGTTVSENDTHTSNIDRTFAFTPAGSVAVKGDWDGNGTDTPGRFTAGLWTLRNSNTAGGPDVTFAFGLPGDVPVVGDWDGDGVDTVGVFRNGVWLLRNSNSFGPPDVVLFFSMFRPDQVPVVGDWNGDGKDTVGIFYSGTWHLRNANTTGQPQIEFNFGSANDQPIVGAWGPIGQPEVSAGSVIVKEGNAGTTQAQVVISLSNVSLSPVAVSYATLALTATAGTDYQSVTGTVAFLPGETTKTVPFTIFGDTIPEADETFRVVLSSPFGATLTPTSNGTVTIADDESPVTRYRLYLAATAEHLYTTDLNEYLTLGGQGWDQEGPAHRVLSSPLPFMGQTPVPLYRLYHTTLGQHLWTTDANEYAVLGGSGWLQEGADGYILPTAIPGVTAPLYRLAFPPLSLHLWTTDLNEYTVLGGQGWLQEGFIGHVIPIP